MVDQELVNWIKSEKAKGHSKQDLINILSEQNHTSKDIEEAFEELKAPAGGGAHVRETFVDPFELPPPPEEADVVPEKEDDDKE